MVLQSVTRKLAGFLVACAIALGSPFVLQWLEQRKHTYPLEFTVLLSMVIIFILCCAVYNPLKVYIASSIILMMIGTRVITNQMVDYIGGVGAGSTYYGTPHFAVILGIVALIFAKLRYPSKVTFGLGKSEMLVLMFTMSVLVAAIIAPFKQASNVQLNLYITLFILFLIWSNVLKLLSRTAIITVVVRTICFGAVIQFGLVLLQLVSGHGLGLSILGEGSLDTRGSGVNVAGVTGTFIHPGPLSVFFLVCISLLFPYVLQKQNHSRLLCFIVAVLGLILTFSRTSLLIGTAIIIIEWIILTSLSVKLSKKKIVMMILAVTIIINAFGSSIFSRFLSLENSPGDNQVEHRLEHIKLAWSYIKKEPLLGYGLNSWSYVMHRTNVSSTNSEEIFYINNPVHNMYLYLWFEGGLLLLLGFIIVVIVILASLIRRVKQGMDFEIGLCAAIVCFLIYGLTGWGLFNGSQLIYIFYFLIAVAGVLALSQQTLRSLME